MASTFRPSRLLASSSSVGVVIAAGCPYHLFFKIDPALGWTVVLMACTSAVASLAWWIPAGFRSITIDEAGIYLRRPLWGDRMIPWADVQHIEMDRLPVFFARWPEFYFLQVKQSDGHRMMISLPWFWPADRTTMMERIGEERSRAAGILAQPRK